MASSADGGPVPFLDLAAMHAEVDAALERAWRDVRSTGAFVGGPAVERFEADWAAFCGTAHAVGVANGTDALQLVLRALGLGPGDEVLVPANTFVATAAAVVLAGATPRFVDVDPDTLLLTADIAEAAVTPRTAAILAVHLYGQPADMDALRRVAARAGLALVEDAAQAHGATWRGRSAGSLGRAGCFSFYPGKNLGALGDAGAVTTDDAALAARVRSLGNHGRAAASKHLHEHVGTNSRLDGLQAAVLSAKLPRLRAWTAARRRVVARYRQELAGSPVRLVAEAADAVSAWHLAVVRVADRDAVRDALDEAGIGTGVHYPVPCHRQEAFAALAGGLRLPVAERAAGEILSLPLSPHTTDAQVDRVCAALRAAAPPAGVPAEPGTRRAS